MPRRVPDYPDAFYAYNKIASWGSYISAWSTLVFFFVLYEAFSSNQSLGRIDKTSVSSSKFTKLIKYYLDKLLYPSSHLHHKNRNMVFYVGRVETFLVGFLFLTLIILGGVFLIQVRNQLLSWNFNNILYFVSLFSFLLIYILISMAFLNRFLIYIVFKGSKSPMNAVVEGVVLSEGLINYQSDLMVLSFSLVLVTILLITALYMFGWINRGARRVGRPITRRFNNDNPDGCKKLPNCYFSTNFHNEQKIHFANNTFRNVNVYSYRTANGQVYNYIFDKKAQRYFAVGVGGTFSLCLSALTGAAIYDHFERRSRNELAPIDRLMDRSQPSSVSTTTNVTDNSVRTTTTNLKGLNISTKPTENIVSNVPSPKSSPTSNKSNQSSGTPRDHCGCNVR
jgi:hypothetical protein